MMLRGWPDVARPRAGGACAHLIRKLRLPVLAAGMALTLVPAADATGTPFVWAGRSSQPGWSFAANWEGGSPPSSAAPLTLEMPHLTGCSGTCYQSENDLNGLTAESIKLDDGDEYALYGKEITLGSGGLAAAPAAGSSGPSGAIIAVPVHLGAPQTWSVTGRSGGGLGENGAAVLGKITGTAGLAFEVGNEAALFLENETEAGAATIAGADAGKPGILNGFVGYFGDLNFQDEQPVNVAHIFFVGSGALGALSTDHAELDVGSGLDPAEGILADSATFDSGSEVAFQITGAGEVAGEDYSQLSSIGPVALGGSSLAVHVSPSSPKSSVCPSLQRGQKFTFVAAEGALTGSFANAPEGGPEIPVTFARVCGQSPRTMRISYQRSGSRQTVTGMVEAKATEEQEARERREAEESREARERQEAQERRDAEAKQREEEAAARKRTEETAAATAKKQQEEAAAMAAATRRAEEAVNRKNEEELSGKNGVLGTQETAKPRPTRAQLLAKALKACKRRPPSKRARCKTMAKKRYGGKTKGKGGKAK